MAKYKRYEFTGFAHKHIRAAAQGGLRTGNHNFAEAPVTIIVMPGYRAPRAMTTEEREKLESKHRQQRKHSKCPPPAKLAKLRAQAQAAARKAAEENARHNQERQAARALLDKIMTEHGVTI